MRVDKKIKKIGVLYLNFYFITQQNCISNELLFVKFKKRFALIKLDKFSRKPSFEKDSFLQVTDGIFIFLNSYFGALQIIFTYRQ